MINIEDGSNLIAWWRERLEKNTDWNSLPKESKKQLLDVFQQCIKDLVNLDINKDELMKLIQYTDVPTVFEAVISMIALPDVEKKSKYQALAYLRRVVLNSEKGKFKIDPEWHKGSPLPKRQGKKVTLEYVREHDPYNFKSYCRFCGSRIRSDNVTGVCIKCQKKGRNGS